MKMMDKLDMVFYISIIDKLYTQQKQFIKYIDVIKFK